MEAQVLPIPVLDAAPVKEARAPRNSAWLEWSGLERLPSGAVSFRDLLFRRSLALSDVAAALFSVLLCTSIVGSDRARLATLLAIPIIVVVSKVIGLYDRDELVIHKTTTDEAPALLQLATTYTLILWLLEPLAFSGHLGREQVAGLWGSLFVTTLVGRAITRRIVTRVVPEERCLMIGDAFICQRVGEKLDAERGAALVGRIDLDALPVTSPHDSNVHFEILRDVCQMLDVHRLILAPAVANTDTMLDLIRCAKGIGVRVTLLPRILEVVGSSVEFDTLGGMPVLGIKRFGLTRSSWIVKRAFDTVGAALGLLFIAPMFGAIALAIKLTSPGPVFFRQERIGRDGRSFRIFKFRTMVVDAEARKPGLQASNEGAEGFFKIEDDPRITRIGGILRATSLDELPQLLNVLRGEMSLVGPRPLIGDEDSLIRGYDRRRLHLMPGMTGPWQILGSSRIPLQEMAKIDYLYTAGWSLWSDVKILLRTVPYVLARRGR